MITLIHALRKLNIDLSVTDGKLKINAPEGVVTKEILEQIKQHRDALVEYIERVAGKKRFSPIKKAALRPHYTLSSAQTRMHFLYEMDKSSVLYNMPQAIHIKGSLDVARLKYTFQQLVTRHESLRTAFRLVDEVPVQVIEDAISFDMEHIRVDASEIPVLVAAFVQPFDLTAAPLLRIKLLEVGANEYYLMMDMHHIISDGVSSGIMVKEFLALYGQEQLPELTIQYKDFSEWQMQPEQQQALETLKEFWMKEFSEEVPLLDLPADFERPATKSNKGDTICFLIDVADKKRLTVIAEQHKCTLFTVCFALYNVFLSRLSGLDDIVTGIPVAGRQHDDLQQVIGMFVNTLPVRNYPKSSLTFSEFLAAVQLKTVNCFDRQAYQLEALIDELKLERTLSRNPLFDVMFSYDNFEEPVVALPGLTFASIDNGFSVAKFDLTCNVSNDDMGLKVGLNYSTALFKESTIQQLASCFKNIIASVIENVQVKLSAIRLMATEEQQVLLETFNQTSQAYPADKTLIDLFEAQAAATPEAIAIRNSTETISYAALSRLSDSVAAYLRTEAGVQPGDCVGVLLEREMMLLPVLYGILKAGAAYIPMDRNYPVDRVNAIIEDAGVKTLVSRSSHLPASLKSFAGLVDLDSRAATLQSYPVTEPLPVVDNRQLAYVIYTSGSTGKPKGVMIEHRSAVNLVWDMQQRYPVTSADVYLLKTNYCFDVSVAEIFGWFLGGGSLYLLPVRGEADAALMLDEIARHKITHVNFVPSMFTFFVEEQKKDAGARLSSLRYIFLAGEALSSELVKKFREYNTSVRLENLYGPTEATIYCSGYSLSALGDARKVPIGVPLGNVKLYILDKHLQLQPIGVAGELCIGGVGVARGYLNNAALTAEKFIANPFEKGMLYRTGDLVKWQADGNVEFLGRIDDQVKVRGFRIQLGEIEYQMSTHHQALESVVVVKEKAGEKYLVGYYTGSAFIPVSEWMSYLSSKLPDYMVPSYYVQLESFPQTTSGKINRKALPDPELQADNVHVMPANEIEEKLLLIWAEVLKLEKEVISTDRSFFELGGHSLRATVMVNKIFRELDVTVPLKEVFENATIQKLAECIKLYGWLSSAGSHNEEPRVEMVF